MLVIYIIGDLATVTWAHYALIEGDRKSSIRGLILTILFAIIFTGLQGFEYYNAPFTIADGIYGSCFYFGTGLIYGAPLKFYIKNTNYFTTANLKISPYWITGFSDAESTFTVKIVKDGSRPLGIRIIPVYAIELHIRDIEVLKKIKEFFNVGSVIIRIRNGKSTGIYSVQSLKDLTKVIIPHFKKYPLITQKQADFLLFTLVVNLMNNKEHLTEEGLKKIISIRASMNKGLTSSLKTIFPGIVEIERPIISNQVIKSPLWLVGFVDGEGCFYLKINKRQICLVFSIYQHSRDSNLFNVIQNYLNCGIIEVVPTRLNTVNFVVYKFEDILQKIIPIFEENSLITQKYLDFYYFKEVSYLILKKEHLTKEGINKILLIKELKKNKVK
jgi:hypothetical protein